MADSGDVHRASVTAPVNIAVIKYWGKRDVALNVPTNSSLSVTLDQSDLCTNTTASCSSRFSGHADTLILNGQQEDLSKQKRTLRCFELLRNLRTALEEKDANLPQLSKLHLKIVTANNFPTAAGLASSAAGFAALVFAIAKLYKLPLNQTQLSEVARQGSGSACRSLFGGYVAWDMGSLADGSDSVAREVAPMSHWPDMRALILVVSAAKKAVSSTAGMQETVRTSALFRERIASIVPKRMSEMEEAIRKRDFEAFARLTMTDSNTFHACCADTYPPIYYMNDASRAAVRLVEMINAHAGRTVAAYTFDAGPNCVIYYLEESTSLVAGFFKRQLSQVDGWSSGRGQAIEALSDGKFSEFESANAGLGATVAVLQSSVGRVILTAVGDGPQETDRHLINAVGES